MASPLHVARVTYNQISPVYLTFGTNTYSQLLIEVTKVTPKDEPPAKAICYVTSPRTTFFTVGRHPSTNIQMPLDAKSVSAKHLAFERVTDGGWKVMDNSTFGTVLYSTWRMKKGDVSMVVPGMQLKIGAKKGEEYRLVIKVLKQGATATTESSGLSTLRQDVTAAEPKLEQQANIFISQPNIIKTCDLVLAARGSGFESVYAAVWNLVMLTESEHLDAYMTAVVALKAVADEESGGVASQAISGDLAELYLGAY